MNTTSKIVSLEDLQSSIVPALRSQGKKIVTTNGAFDLLHVGHKRALEASKALGDILIVGLNSDASIKQYKSDLRPIISEADRAEMLSGLACVDFIVIFPETDPIHFIDVVKPDVHTKSGDYKVGELKESAVIRENGGQEVILPFVEGKSTTSIIEYIVKTCGKNGKN